MSNGSISARPSTDDVAHRPHVAVIGAGLAGLTCATYLVMNGVRVTLIEKEARMGGQCWTRYEDNGVTWEAGGEGFVRRAVAVPRIARALGIEEDIVPQEPVENYEIDENYTLIQLDRGVAAKKLGFQVKKEDFGRGISSFRRGMGELIDSMHSCLEESPLCDIKLNTEVSLLERGADAARTRVTWDGGEMVADEVVIATPEKAACAMLGEEPFHGELMSHVSVYCLVRELSESEGWHSFSIPADMQSDFDGLRAVALVDEKFPGRSPPGTALFRCYYRPRTEPLRNWSDDEWSQLASRALMKICSLADHDVLASYVSRWDSALPVFNDEYRAAVEKLRGSVADQHVHLIGAAFAGAGIEAAVKSGEDAAVEILKMRPQFNAVVASMETHQSV